MEKVYAKSLEIKGEIKYVGTGENPDDNPWFNLWKRCLKEAYEKECSMPEELNVDDKNNSLDSN